MKYALVFYTVVYGFPAIVDDMDGPQQFNQARACIGHAVKVQPILERMLAEFTQTPDMIINWRCERIRRKQ